MKRYVGTILFVIVVTTLLGCSTSTLAVKQPNSTNEQVSVEQSNNEGAVVFTELLLDQENSYIALSNNDATGFNRWVPFYFFLQNRVLWWRFILIK